MRDTELGLGTVRNDITLHLLGTPCLSGSTGGSFPAKGFALCAVLLLTTPGRVTRQLAATLIHETDEDAKALGYLRQVLLRMKRAWPRTLPPLVETSGPFLLPGPGLGMSDLGRFLAEDASGDPHRQAELLMLFRGDLLGDLAPGSQALDEWLHVERAKLRERFFAKASFTLLELTRFGRADGQQLRDIASHLLHVDPVREHSYRTIIEAYGRNGMFTDAEAAHGQLQRMLKIEYGEKPSPETVSVAQKVFAAARGRRELIAAPVRPSTLPRIALMRPTTATSESEALVSLAGAFVEDVASNLSRYRTFNVIAPHSSFSASMRQRTSRLALRADYVVSSLIIPGSMTLSMTAQRTQDDEIIWSADHSCDPARLPMSFRFASRGLASVLADAVERDRLSASVPAVKADSYRNYLAGRILLRNADLAQLRLARKRFEAAAQAGGAAAFGEPHARIAQTLQLEWLMLGGTDPFLLQSAMVAARRAVAIDPASGTGHWMEGVVALYQRDYGRSMDKFAEAESLSPNSADLLLQYADALAHLGENEAARERFERAIDLNPLAPDHYWWAGASIAFNRRDFGEAVMLCSRMENAEPAVRLLGASHGLLGNLEEARGYGDRIAQLFPGMSAEEFVKLCPDRDSETSRLFLEGLRLAGIP